MSSKGKRIGVFGGSFNPPHLAHLIAAEYAVSQLALDTLLFIPARIPPHKQHLTLASSEDRVHMVELAVQGNEKFAVSSIELQREGPSYTIDTLLKLQEEMQPASMHLLIGADNLLIFSSWYRVEEIKKIAKIAVMARPTFDLATAPTEHLQNIEIVHIPLLEISSTAIRERVAQGKSIRYLVPDTVHQYIEEQHLYRK